MKLSVLIHLYLIYRKLVVKLSMPEKHYCRDLASKWGWREGEKTGELKKVLSDMDQNQTDFLYLFPFETL